MYINNPSNMDTIEGLHSVPSIDATTNLRLRDVVGNKGDLLDVASVSTTKSVLAKLKGILSLMVAAATDSVSATNARDGIGRKTDTERKALSNSYSQIAYLKGMMRYQTLHDVPKFIRARQSTNTYVVLVNHTDRCILTGIYCAIHGTGEVDIKIVLEGTTIWNGTILRGTAGSAVAIPFHHRSDSGLNVQYRSSIAGQEVEVGVAYTVET